MNINQKNEDKDLRRAIVETIAFFDLFSFPLTTNEVLKYLKIKSDYLEISKNLNQLLEQRTLGRKDGLYFLAGKVSSVEERKRRYNYSARKFKITLKIAKYFRYIPWIRLICVANLIGRDNLSDRGDIDLFIVSNKNRLWLTRFFTVLTAKFLNARPQKDKKKDKICLSFFVSEENLNIENIRESEDDMYFNYWFLNLAPIYSCDNIFFELMESNKKLIGRFPNYFYQEISNKRKIKIINNNFYKKNWELFFGGLEQRMKKIQLKIMPNNLLKLASQKKGVILTDSIIKLHLNDRRDEFSKRYNEIISKIKI